MERHTHPFNGPLSETTRVSRYQKGETNLDFAEARDSEWQWHQPDHMQVCTSLQTDNHASTPPLSFFTGQTPFLPPNQQRQRTEGKGKALDVNEHWQQMKCIMMETAQDVCGMTKGPHRHKETWWWNEEVAEAVREKKIKYGKWKKENTKEAWKEYKKSRQNAKRVISSAKEKKQNECANDLNDSLRECENETFRMVKQMVKEIQDITGLNCIKGASGSDCR